MGKHPQSCVEDVGGVQLVPVEGTQVGAGDKSHVREHALYDYLAAVQHEQAAQLIITLPGRFGGDAAPTPAQQLPLEPAGDKPVGDGRGRKNEGAGAENGHNRGASDKAPNEQTRVGETPNTNNVATAEVDSAPASTAHQGSTPGAGTGAPPLPMSTASQLGLMVVRIDFSTPSPSPPSTTGPVSSASDPPSAQVGGAVCFMDGSWSVAHPQLRRTSSAFPCVDLPNTYYTFDIHLEVPTDHTAVCSGTLLGRSAVVLADEEGQRKPAETQVYHYELPTPTSPSHVAFVCGPMAVLPQYKPDAEQQAQQIISDVLGQAKVQQQQESTTTITHFGPKAQKDLIQSSGRWMYLPMEAFEAYLGCRRFKEREAILLADDGEAPPLSPRTPLVPGGKETISHLPFGNSFGLRLLEARGAEGWEGHGG
eukprot:gene8520-4819_t